MSPMALVAAPHFASVQVGLGEGVVVAALAKEPIGSDDQHLVDVAALEFDLPPVELPRIGQEERRQHGTNVLPALRDIRLDFIEYLATWPGWPGHPPQKPARTIVGVRNILRSTHLTRLSQISDVGNGGQTALPAPSLTGHPVDVVHSFAIEIGGRKFAALPKLPHHRSRSGDGQALVEQLLERVERRPRDSIVRLARRVEDSFKAPANLVRSPTRHVEFQGDALRGHEQLPRIGRFPVLRPHHRHHEARADSRGIEFTQARSEP